MEDISNKTLALLLGVAIVVSLVGIFTAETGTIITGRATDTGTGTLDFETDSVVDITVSGTINWGIGAVTTGQDSATLYSDGTATLNGNWSTQNTPITVENVGTENVSLTIYSSNDAEHFIGGTSPAMTFTATQSEANSCPGTLAGATTAYTNDTGTSVCDSFGTLGTANALEVDFTLTVPADADTSTHTQTVTFTGTGI